MSNPLRTETYERIRQRDLTTERTMTERDILLVEAKAMQLVIRAVDTPAALKERCESRLAAIHAQLDGYPLALFVPRRARFVQLVKEIAVK